MGDDLPGTRPRLRALVTRASTDAATLCAELRSRGVEPVAVPLLRREIQTEAVRGAARRGHDGWVLTSPAAARAMEGVGPRPRWVAAVGPATREAAEELGLTVGIVPDRSLRTALVDALGPLDGQRVLYPRADLAPPGLAEALRASGAVVDEVVAYRNVEPQGAGEALARIWPVDLVVLLSGSAARRLALHQPPPWPAATRVIAIGPSTSSEAQAAGICVHAIADPHTLDGLLAAVEAQLTG